MATVCRLPTAPFTTGKLSVLIKIQERPSGRELHSLGFLKSGRHPKSTHANASVATDGKYAVAFFGSEGLYCYDYNGSLVWKKNFGYLNLLHSIIRQRSGSLPVHP